MPAGAVHCLLASRPLPPPWRDWREAARPSVAQESRTSSGAGDQPAARPVLTVFSGATDSPDPEHPCTSRPQDAALQSEESLAEKAWSAAWDALRPPARIKTEKRRRKGEARDESADVDRRGKRRKGSSRPRLALQGLATPARAQLLAVSLLALEEQLAELPVDFVRCGTEAEWKLLLPALMASCSLIAARAWLGYVPVAMEAEAIQLTARLRAGTGRFELKILVPAHSDVVTNNVRIDSDSSTKEELRRHFWDAASEKAVLHALVLKRLHLEEPAEPALDESLDESALELRAASERADSQQATSTCGSQELTDPQQLRPDFWTGVCASLGLRDVRRYGWRRRREFRGREGTYGASLEPSDRIKASIDLRMGTKNAAAALLTDETRGPRGWGERRSSATLDPQLPRLEENAPLVLHDIAVTIADAVAAAYLSEAAEGLSGGPAKSKSGALSDAVWPTFLHPRLASTRALERFRNQIAFRRLWSRSWEDIVAIYEDRHVLWTIGPGAALEKRSMPARRSKELKALKGWRANVGLFLEALDVAAPLVQAAIRRGSEAIAWLLVALIGRGLGLIFRGIRQSVKPNKRSEKGDDEAPDLSFA